MATNIQTYYTSTRRKTDTHPADMLKPDDAQYRATRLAAASLAFLGPLALQPLPRPLKLLFCGLRAARLGVALGHDGREDGVELGFPLGPAL